MVANVYASKEEWLCCDLAHLYFLMIYGSNYCFDAFRELFNLCPTVYISVP